MTFKVPKATTDDQQPNTWTILEVLHGGRYYKGRVSMTETFVNGWKQREIHGTRGRVYECPHCGCLMLYAPDDCPECGRKMGDRT